MSTGTLCPACGAPTVSRSATRPRYCGECYRLRRRESRRAWEVKNPGGTARAIQAWKEAHREETRAKGRIVVNHAMTCAECGEGFTRGGSRGRIPKWCPTCRAARDLSISADYRQRHPEKILTLAKLGGARRRAASREVVAEKVDRLTVFARDGWICRLCQMPVFQVLKYPNPWSPSLDHIIPLSLGGDHTYANTQLAHLRCNLRKSNRVEVA